jgi:hypothetical protein
VSGLLVASVFCKLADSTASSNVLRSFAALIKSQIVFDFVTDGCIVGRRVGGAVVGRNVGWSGGTPWEGRNVGCGVGLMVGLGLEPFVGLGLASFVGPAVDTVDKAGACEGILVGDFVGFLLAGPLVDGNVGFSVNGAPEGFVVGLYVGCSVGLFVGGVVGVLVGMLRLRLKLKLCPIMPLPSPRISSHGEAVPLSFVEVEVSVVEGSDVGASTMLVVVTMLEEVGAWVFTGAADGSVFVVSS